MNTPISYTSHRDKQDGYNYPSVENQRSVEDALETFLLYEVGFGGRVTDVSETRVEIVTSVMNCLDTTVFEGTAEAMLPLVQVAVVAVKVQAETRTPSDHVMDRIMEITKGNPLLIKLSSGMLIGEDHLRRIMLYGLGLPQEDIERWSSLRVSNKELLTSLMWAHAGDCTYEEAYQMCAQPR